MTPRIILVAVALALAATLTACGTTPDERVIEPEPMPGESPGAALRLAPGLYDLEDGTAQAVGTLEYVDLEGGFWAIVGGTEAEGNVGEVVAVIANSADLGSVPSDLEGRLVTAVGKRLDGVSIRMAGPEIEVTELTELSDTMDPAE